jgi:hypothetical protein
MQRLRQRGRIEETVFIDVDPATGLERRRDVTEAAVQEHTGEAYKIPAGGYNAPILMHPKAFTSFLAAPGVELRRLGAFYDQAGPEGDVRITVLRLFDGGTHGLDAERAQVAWALDSGLEIEGDLQPGRACVYSPRGERLAVSALGSVDLYVVEFPRLD